MNTACEVLFLPFTPFQPPRERAFSHPKFLVMNHPLASSPRSGGNGDVAHLMEKNASHSHLGDIKTIVGTGDGDEVAMTLCSPKFLVG